MIANNENSVSTVSATDGSFQTFETAALDAVLAIAYEPSGSRCAIAAADHKIRIYDCEDQSKGVLPTVLDQWRAHDAEILDIQWIPGPHSGHLATTGADNKVKIWREDRSQSPLSGRRFRCIMSQAPASHVPYTSISFHSDEDHDLYLVLVTYDGLLTLLEPSELDSLASWRVTDQFYPFGKFSHGNEPRFCVSFHPGPAKSPETLLTLALSAGHLLKIYVAVQLPAASYATTMREGDLQLRETLAFAVNQNSNTGATQPPSINHLAWQPGFLNPYDIIALACTDGTVRIIEVSTPKPAFPIDKADTEPRQGFRKPLPPASPSSSSSSSSDDDDDNADTTSINAEREKAPVSHHRRDSAASNTSYPPPSSRVSALGNSLINPIPAPSRPQAPANLRPSAHESDVLTHDEEGRVCWKVIWTYDGSTLASSGENSEVAMWRRAIMEDGKGGNRIAGPFMEWSRTRGGDND